MDENPLTLSATSLTPPPHNGPQWPAPTPISTPPRWFRYAMIWQFYWAEDLGDADSTAEAWSKGDCVEGNDKYPLCLSYSASYRVSFCEVIFFGTMAILAGFKPAIHDLGWDVKLSFYAILLIGITWAPSNIFDDHGYAWFARVGAFIFIVLQQIILLDGGYRLNETLKALGGQQGYEEGWNKWLALLLGLSVGFYLAAFVGIVLLFVYYTGEEGNRCPESTSFVSITMVLILVFTALQLVSDPENGHNLLVSSIVAAYAVYLTYISVSSNPVEHCNPSYEIEGSDTFSLVLGLTITFISICGTVYFSSKSVTGLVGGEGGSPASNYVRLETVLTTDAKGPSNTGADGNPTIQEQPTAGGGGGYSYPKRSLAMIEAIDDDGGTAWRFNVVMTLISMYWCMVLTNWANPVTGTNEDGDVKDGSPTGGITAMWMNIVACWICVLLYIWTLVAPILYPDRDFS
mmetsp:Transcript_48806/g.137421  ORF Transcript_48806/g.137421 Transcript_48806/m.137421 type:complete len:460 (+) Transcript_48806:574-1953(+)